MEQIEAKQSFYSKVGEMPPLKHKVGESFDIEKSEVVAWLMAQPQTKEWAFRQAAGRGLIEYDESSGTWRGVRKAVPVQADYARKPRKSSGRPVGRPKRLKDEEVMAAIPAEGLHSSGIARSLNIPVSTATGYLLRLEREGKIRAARMYLSTVWHRPVAVAVEDIDP